ncbi:MAG: RNA polymerase sigma factor, partial [Candidatus Limnocylindrales bacterium]
RALVDRARYGDLDAFEEIVRARMDAVYRLSFAILGDEDDARDAAQETFVTAWRQIDRLRDADRFDGWLRRVAVNAARMVHRSRRRRGVREIPASRVGGVTDMPAVARPSDADAATLDLALRRLPIEQRSILALHHLEGRPLTDLALILEIPVGTVKSRLHAARQALQAAIDAEGRDE